ncbi:glycine/D-amino acid oxidase-like deaminating enzyme/nitrite reductase/ring-hydroxylating ferredoxin subunit [Arthrobacter sp. V4I6]|uniref:FAD-dependent oxidoreductase n=1 Tax=Arthrobacter sp. V4I6 TaxID=3042281 RepID=UPI0027881F41|nr:FAD-dependent oxidoreductase [Arthrobacter sp. V4I6]MDQ0855498.1 glycine/D-amino acid oxidase-like deaminating enzyme/nitrite reductase/ring-hydroxylating ferredoxin subunit [Arthrobacter sp. V4I6]
MTSLWLDTAGLFITDPLIPESRYDAVVVGAGITGLSSALLLARSGMKVAVLEARTVGAGTTGHTTAKLSLLQGTVLSALRRQYPQKVVTAYVEANREGQAWLLRFLAERGVPFQQRDAYTYSVTDGGSERVAAELTVAKAAGLDVEEGVDTELPFATRRTIALRGQAQFNPMDVLGALAGDFRDHGGVLVQGARVRNVKTGAGAAVETDAGTIHADLVVLATGVPILDRGLYFAKLKASQSYAAALRLPASAPIPSGMYLSAETPGRSLRSYPAAAGELLVVGGNGHQVGREPSPRRRLDELLDWARFHFPGAEVTHSWSGEDYRATNLMPFIGKLPRGGGKIFFATGYNKWGMSNSIAAALDLSAQILGGNLHWARTIRRRVTSPAGAAAAITLNADVAKTLVVSWAKAELAAPESARTVPAEGEGTVVRKDRRPVAVSTVEGATCRLSAVCTHLGGLVSWNDAEQSWDCPLHGSRFSASGEVLQGPATKNLPAAEN